MAENESPLIIKKVDSAQNYIKENYSDTIGLATSILGQVLLGTLKSSKRSKEVIKLCLKDMKHQFSDRVAEDPRMEIDFMNTICNVSHPNFVRFIEAVEDNKLYVMRLEYISGGDMCTYLQNLGSGVGALRAKKYAIQLTKAVHFMHCNGYCHLDISLENVLWDKKTDTIKLCDFGLSRKFPNGDALAMFNAATIRPGKKGYMSPEIYAYQRFNGMKSDVFSLGVLIFILLTGFPPFTTPNASDKCFQFMYYGKLEWLLKQWKLNEIIDTECRDLLSKIFCHPKKRISIKQMLEHSWLDQSVADVEEEMLQYRQQSSVELKVERNEKEKEIMPKKRKSIIKKKRLSKTKNVRKRPKKKEAPAQKVCIYNKRIESKNRSKSITIDISQTLLSEFGATVRVKKSRSKSLAINMVNKDPKVYNLQQTKRRNSTNLNASHKKLSDRTESPYSAQSDGSSHSNQSMTDDHKSSPSNSPSITNRNSANLRDHDDPAPIVNDTQLITKKLSDVSMNNGNFAVSDDNDHGLFDNDRKEGDYETYPYEYHERNGKNTQERTLSIASQESAGSIHSNHSDNSELAKDAIIKSLPSNPNKNIDDKTNQSKSY